MRITDALSMVIAEIRSIMISCFAVISSTSINNIKLGKKYIQVKSELSIILIKRTA